MSTYHILRIEAGDDNVEKVVDEIEAGDIEENVLVVLQALVAGGGGVGGGDGRCGCARRDHWWHMELITEYLHHLAMLLLV